MEANKYNGVVLRDIPFDVFSLFSRGNQAVHAAILLLAAGLCKEDVEGAVRYDVLTDAIRRDGILEGKDESSDAASSESQEINLLKNYRLLRRQSRYDESEKKWIDYVYMTGRGQKVTDFLVSISQSDIRQTKEANIQSALLSMREAGSDLPSKDIILYDALKAAHEGIADLITHLSTYSGTFRDYIEENTCSFETAAQAREWIDRMFRSNLIMEYFTIVDTAYEYSAKLSEIRTIAEKLQERDDLAGQIIDDEYRRRTEIAKKTPQIKASREDIRKDVYTRIKRLREMTDFEYHSYIAQIQKLVDSVIERTYFVLASFGAGNSSGTIVDMLTKLIRYSGTCNKEIPRSISNLYSQKLADGNSFCRAPMQDANKEAASVEIPDADIFDEDTENEHISRKEDAFNMARRIVLPGRAVRAEEFPCEDIEDYLLMFILAGSADKENNPSSDLDFAPDGTEFIKGSFILPGGTYTRDIAEAGTGGEA